VDGQKEIERDIERNDCMKFVGLAGRLEIYIRVNFSPKSTGQDNRLKTQVVFLYVTEFLLFSGHIILVFRAFKD
jgi:hypothetical protein